MKKTFGEYLKEKRIEKEISLRGLALKLDLAPSYVSDIEKGRRYAPDKTKLDKIAEILNIKGEDLNFFYDLASISRQEAPADIKDFVIKNKNAKVMLRTVKNLDKQQQKKVLDFIKNIKSDDE